MKADAQKEIIKTIKEFLLEQQDVAFAYLFGSFVRGGRYLDIDLGLYLEPSADLIRIGSLQAALDTLTDNKADLVILNEVLDKKPVLGYQVITQGLLLFSRNDAFHLNFKRRVLGRYFDTARLRQKMDQAFANRVKSDRFGLRNYE